MASESEGYCFSELELESFQQSLQRCNGSSRPLLVGLSGGVDSVTLLHLCWRYKQLFPEFELAALYVHHGLSDNADQWQTFCKKYCEQLNVSFFVQSVIVHQGSRESLEEQARKARYKVFELYSKQYNIACAHHLDDQCETLFLNLKRGSGVAGLACMPQQRRLGSSYLIRPLLPFSRQSIESYALKYKLHHIIDESNFDVSIDRNYLRHQVLPLLKSRWQGFSEQVAKSCQLLQQSQLLHDELASVDAEIYVNESDELSESIINLSEPRQINLIRFWLKRCSGCYPAYSQLEQFLVQMRSKHDRVPEVAISGGWVRRYQGRWSWWLYSPVSHPCGMIWKYPFCQLKINDCGYLKKSKGGFLIPPEKDQSIFIKFRHEVGNPKLRPFGRGGSRSLKKLLQELSVPPWLRNQIPLIYYGDTWVALGDHIIDENFYDLNRQGWQISWQIYSDT